MFITTLDQIDPKLKFCDKAEENGQQNCVKKHAGERQQQHISWISTANINLAMKTAKMAVIISNYGDENSCENHEIYRENRS